MATSSKSANAKFYIQQAQDFRRMDGDCEVKHMTRSAYEQSIPYLDSIGAREDLTAYGRSRGTRAVLYSCPQWKSRCWIVFLD